MKTQRLRLIALFVVIVHFGVSLIHGFAHQGAGVALDVFDSAYVVIIITLAPLVAAALLFTRLNRLGAWLLTLSMFGALAFGLFKHFILPGIDNVTQVHGAWHSLFLQSAVGIAVVELAGWIAGVWLVRLVKD